MKEMNKQTRLKCAPITIIAIVGESGTGKTTLAKYLVKRCKKVKEVISYTTRPMRPGEVNGSDHFFVSEKDVPPREKMFAHTKYGGYDYWVEIEQVDCTQPLVYIIDEKGLTEMWENWVGEIDVFAIYLKRPNNPTDTSRRKRDKHRITIEDDSYDMVFINDYDTAEEFCMMATYQFVRLFEYFIVDKLSR